MISAKQDAKSDSGFFLSDLLLRRLCFLFSGFVNQWLSVRIRPLAVDAEGTGQINKIVSFVDNSTDFGSGVGIPSPSGFEPEARTIPNTLKTTEDSCDTEVSLVR